MIKKNKFFALSFLSVAILSLSACSTVREYWQYYDGNLDTSLREPTGYYEHTKAKNIPDQLVTPAGLNTPPIDPTLSIPDNAIQKGPLGENIDVRPPIVFLKSKHGLAGQFINGESIIWFDANGTHGIDNEDKAWALLGKVLNNMHIKVGNVTEGAYELTTASADFNEYGQPYSMLDLDSKGLRYNQIYRIRIGKNKYGHVGIATALIGSMTKLSNGKEMQNTLTPIELERFAIGFSKEIIAEVERSYEIENNLPDELQVNLDRDVNDEDCFRLAIPYDIAWPLVRKMLPKYGFTILEYSISSSTINVKYEEPKSSFFKEEGIDSFKIESDDYIIRIALDKNKSVITFYDSDDKPLPTNVITALYPGFSKALQKEYKKFKETGFSGGI